MNSPADLDRAVPCRTAPCRVAVYVPVVVAGRRYALLRAGLAAADAGAPPLPLGGSRSGRSGGAVRGAALHPHRAAALARHAHVLPEVSDGWPILRAPSWHLAHEPLCLQLPQGHPPQPHVPTGVLSLAQQSHPLPDGDGRGPHHAQPSQAAVPLLDGQYTFPFTFKFKLRDLKCK